MSERITPASVFIQKLREKEAKRVPVINKEPALVYDYQAYKDKRQKGLGGDAA